MQAYVRHLKGITFAGKANSNHWVMMDGSSKFGGSDAASGPMELVLIALGGCTGSDVASILEKKRVRLDGFDMNITADRTQEHPKVFSKIHIEYVFYGDDIKNNDVLKAIELSQEKYCSVSAILKKSAEVTFSYEIKKATDRGQEVVG
jgi:putative redox protein